MNKNTTCGILIFNILIVPMLIKELNVIYKDLCLINIAFNVEIQFVEQVQGGSVTPLLKGFMDLELIMQAKSWLRQKAIGSFDWMRAEM